jgi:hypothetical protein
MNQFLTPLDVLLSLGLHLLLSLLLVVIILLKALYGEQLWCLLAHRRHWERSVITSRCFTLQRTVCTKCGSRLVKRIFHCPT